MKVLGLLKADLERQYTLAGIGCRANVWRVLARLAHPRFLPLVILRASHAICMLRVPFIPQLLGYLNVLMFGLDVAPRCEIGPGLFLPHTAGTVIGASRIGQNVTIFQNVTLGAKGLDMGWNPDLRPIVCDNVILGAGCKILGGISLGVGVKVGANAVVLISIDANSVAVGIPARALQAAGRVVSVTEEV
jgi:serine O-acetyltransferase